MSNNMKSTKNEANYQWSKVNGVESVCRSPCSIITRGHCWLVVGNKTPTVVEVRGRCCPRHRSPQCPPEWPNCGGRSLQWRTTLSVFSFFFHGRTEFSVALGNAEKTCAWIYLWSRMVFARRVRVGLINKLIHRPTIGWPPATAGL